LKNHDSLYVSENYDSSIKDGGEKKRQLPGEAEKVKCLTRILMFLSQKFRKKQNQRGPKHLAKSTASPMLTFLELPLIAIHDK
jgi:hypothetical protein